MPNLNAELRPYNVDTEAILRYSPNQRLLGSITRFSRLLETHGYFVPVYSELALQQLPNIPTEKKLQIAEYFECWSQWIEPLATRFTFDNEINLLKLALNKHGFKADEKFWNTIEEGQIIEFYDENMIQLYRSFNFFSITGYSLLDISVFEWYLLWDRSSRVLKNVAGELNAALESYIPAKRFVTPKHLIREIYNTTNSQTFIPRVALAEFLFLGSLSSTNTIVDANKTVSKGFICSSVGKLIAVGKESENIEFL